MHEVRTLFAAAGLRVHEFRCEASSHEPGREEAAANDEIALPRRGLFVRHRRHDEEVADPGRALFFARGEAYRVSHPRGGGDLCTVLTIPAEQVADRGRRFARPAASTSAATELLHRRLLCAFRDGEGDRLALEESAHALVDSLLALIGSDRSSGRPSNRESDSRRRALARATQQLVAARFRERLTLAGLARTAGCSPFHLCRAFRAELGLPVHRWQTRLRLRAALEALLAGADDLTVLALELGFSDHAHFTRSFRREFGRAPSACRTRADADELRELSKIVQAGPDAAT